VVASSPADSEATDEYADGWRQLQAHLRDGQSWSGLERHCVFLNLGDAQFADASAVSGLDFPDDGRGMAVVDWDNDGDLDLWFSNRTGPRARFLRNDSASKNSFVAFRLRSASQNPDAIGAEVELFFKGSDEERHVRTLRAGSGFISQSSKWVHFGVPEGKEISHVTVRWPAGPSSDHSGVTAGSRWVLKDTTPEPQAWEEMARTVDLQAGGVSASPPTTTARVPIIHPLPLLGATVEAPDGRRVPLQPKADGGVLLTLWADWCVNCKRELVKLQREKALLDQTGLRVIALSVDEPSERTAGDAFLDQISWAFERGYAHQELLGILAVAQRVLLDRPHADAIPTSYLIDGQGRIQVIYRGPVDAAQVVEDAKAFDLTPLERREVNAHFDGWWSTDNIPTRYTLMAIQLRNRGYPELSAEYLKRITIRGDAEDAPVYAVNRIVGSEINTGIELMNGGETVNAVASFKRAVALRPRHAVGNRLLGVCLQRLGRSREAHPHLETAIEEDPENAVTRNDLGLALIDLNRMEEAAASFRESIELDPEFPNPHFNLGVYHARRSEFDESAALIQVAVKLRPDYVQAWSTLGRVYSLQAKPTEAAAALKRALELHDADPDIILLYGQSLVQAGQPDEARTLLTKLRALDPARAATLEQLLGP